MRPLVWFRADLRVADHPALHAAARAASRGVVAVFTICPKQWLAHDTAPVKVDFIRRNLEELSVALEKKRIALRIIETPDFDGVPEALLRLASECECDGLYFNREYEANERTRDERVTEAFEEAGRTVHTFTDQCVFEPGELRTGSDGFYTVFTPFKKTWHRALDADRERGTPLGTPKKQAEMVGRSDAIPARIDGFDPDAGRPDLWTAGERSAKGRLAAFLRDRVDAYDEQRDVPSVNGTSVLSPYLASGVISLRTCVHAVLEANDGRLDSGAAGAVTWLTELIWREFYKHVLVGFPRVSRHRAFKPATEAIVWNDDDDAFGAWCAGRTGIPIVDAAMRQLVQTGWMHNRLRMVTAMFLSKNLFLDWRRGEAFFMRRLVDGDLSANNGGWQWSASTGTDAAPYFRIFNPLSQSKRFDPDGAFIRRFVPELEGVEAGALHDPGRMPEGVEYPAPIVDLSASRAAAIAAFKALRD